jgi:hypothetical protein
MSYITLYKLTLFFFLLNLTANLIIIFINHVILLNIIYDFGYSSPSLIITL